MHGSPQPERCLLACVLVCLRGGGIYIYIYIYIYMYIGDARTLRASLRGGGGGRTALQAIIALLNCLFAL
jgi:hypothetical protein